MKNKIKKFLVKGNLSNQDNRKSAGITLVAFIITIIILLILAGISIAGLTNMGLLGKVQEAKNKTDMAETKQNTVIKEYENAIANYAKVGSNREDSESTKTQKTMSGTEHFTGEYYFNGKPIYEKTLHISNLASSSSTDTIYKHGIENVDTIWFNPSKCLVIWPDNSTNMLPYTRTLIPSAGIDLYGPSNESFIIQVGMDRHTVQAYVTLLYTKTTDQATITTSIPEAEIK